LCLLFLSHFTTSIFQCLVLFSFTFVFAFFDSFMNSRGLVFTPAVLPLLFRISLMFPSHSYIVLGSFVYSYLLIFPNYPRFFIQSIILGFYIFLLTSIFRNFHPPCDDNVFVFKLFFLYIFLFLCLLYLFP
jgi:hypothetical protein